MRLFFVLVVCPFSKITLHWTEIECYRRFEKSYTQLIVAETLMDLQAYGVKTRAWIHGMWAEGFDGAHRAAAGLA